VIDRRAYILRIICKKAEDVATIYSEVTRLNGSKPGDRNFFIIVAVENIIQGKWDGKWDVFNYQFLGNPKTIIVDELWLNKIFKRILTYTEDSATLYYDILYSKSLRGFVNKDITLDKHKVGNFVNTSSDLIHRQRRHSAYIGKNGHYIHPVKIPSRGNSSNYD